MSAKQDKVIEISYRQLVIDKYPEIKLAVFNRAFKFHLNSFDLLSLVNERLSVNINNNQFQNRTIKEFWGYIHRLIMTCAIDLKEATPIHEELQYHDREAENTLELKLTSNALSNKVYASLKSDIYRKVFTEIFINQAGYEDTAKALNIGLSRLKGIIFYIRRKANDQYGSEYRTAIYN